MAEKSRITIIGGGVGGYPAAIKAARLGAEVTLIEKADLGGTCLNWGCVPTKSLLQSAEVMRVVKESEVFGIKTGTPRVDFPAVMKRKKQVVDKLRKGVELLLAAKKIKVLKGIAEILDPRTVKVGETGEKVQNDALIIATGSIPSIPPIPGLDGSNTWDSNDFLAMDKLPAGAAVIGGGVVGVELAQVLSGLGCETTILELMPQLVPNLDREVANLLETALKEQGVAIVTGASVTQMQALKNRSSVSYSVAGETREITVERIILATGRVPFTDGLNAERLGLEIQQRSIRVDERMQTNIPGVYAVGDVVGGSMLAHVAMAEGECAAVNALGGQRVMNYKAVPSCIYTNPEVASVGLSEEQARDKCEVQVGRFPLAGSGKAAVLNQSLGLVKIVADKRYGEIVGVHVIGPHATELIAEAVLAMTLESTVEEVAHAIHPHPTVSESMMEAALSLVGGSIHMP